MPTVVGNLARYPARSSLSWYLSILLIGTAILAHPLCSRQPEDAPLSWLDAMFTATSALCVTGLSVRSTPDDFSWYGQLVILALIQTGGIGIMTITTFVMASTGARAGLRQQVVVAETLGATGTTNLRSIIQQVLLVTLVAEGAGALLLFPRFLAVVPSWQDALWYSVFHAVSAYCNAGFGLYNDNVTLFAGDWWVNLTLMGLIITGGIGYPVINDVLRCLRTPGRDMWQNLRLHTKLTLLTTVVLIFGGAMALSWLEADGLLADRPLSERLLVPLFHSVSCRTAGFNSVTMSDFSDASLFVMILLMTIGGGACSTAGGVKVSTAAMLFLHALTRLQGYRFVNVFRRTIPPTAIDRAMASVALFAVIGVMALTCVLVVEQGQYAQTSGNARFLDALFEVVSALGTVGLSTGITAILSDGGKFVLIVLMLMGRLGPISVFAAVTLERRYQPRFASDEPLVG